MESFRSWVSVQYGNPPSGEIESLLFSPTGGHWCVDYWLCDEGEEGRVVTNR